MSTISDGGTAFPQQHPHRNGHGDTFFAEPGMSLRDYFAGQALLICVKWDGRGYDEWAREAYALADAMLAERAKGGA